MRWVTAVHLEQWANTLSSRYHFRDRWASVLSDALASGRWSYQQVKTLILSWPDERATWDFVHTLGDKVEKEYWAESSIQWVTGSGEDLNFAARKLLDAERPLAALRAMHHSAELDWSAFSH